MVAPISSPPEWPTVWVCACGWHNVGHVGTCSACDFAKTVALVARLSADFAHAHVEPIDELDLAKAQREQEDSNEM